MSVNSDQNLIRDRGRSKPVTANQLALAPGWLVQSRQGRDQGRFYVVVSMDADGFALVTDGAKRPLSRPKRKNPKHLLAWGPLNCSVGEQLRTGGKVTDAEISERLLEAAERVNTDEITE